MREIAQNFRWLLDLIDIFVVAFILYRIFLLLKATMAVRLVLVLAILFFSFLATSASGLWTVNWLIGNFLSYAVLILVIIFQYDIRRAVIASRRTSFGGDREKEEPHEIIEELVSAAESLASRSIGALVVVEREMPLDNFMAVGTEIDAKVTSELLTSIFLPYSPIHDGAVIIQKGKLTKAGCFLPLTQNPEISKTYGTRHRAAIGLSELVDSVVLVVSEETGKISVVVGGKMTRELDSTNLRKVLRRLLETRWLQ